MPTHVDLECCSNSGITCIVCQARAHAVELKLRNASKWAWSKMVGSIVIYVHLTGIFKPHPFSACGIGFMGGGGG